MNASPLLDALAQLDARFTIGFAQSRAESHFVRRHGQTLSTRNGDFSLDWIYDLRLFCSDAEWHWWWDQNDRGGRAALLDDAVACGRGWEPLPASVRLLRGTVRETDSAGWVRLHDGHARSLWVPVSGGQTGTKVERLAVGVVEYVSVEPANGNAAVVAERFTDIKEYPGVR